MELLIACLFSLFVLLSCFVVAIFGKKWNLKILIAFAAGGLLSITILDFLTHSFEPAQHLNENFKNSTDTLHHFPITSLFILLGILLQALIEAYIIPRLSFLDKFIVKPSLHNNNKVSHSHSHSHLLSPASVCSIVACLTVCSFFDGVRFFASLKIHYSTALITGLALFLHLVSEGALVAVMGFASKIKIKVILFLSFFISGAFCLGSLFSYVFAKQFHSQNLIAFASGILLFVCFIHLIPFSLKNKHKHWLFLGIVSFAILNLLSH